MKNPLAEHAPLVRISVVDRLVDDLRHQILAGFLPAGQALTQAALVESYQVSRPTATDALRTLQRHHGLLEQQQHSSYRVRAYVTDELPEIMKAQRLIEIECFVENLSTKPKAAKALAAARFILHSNIEGMAATENGSVPGILEHDFAFHAALMKVAGSPWIDTLHSRSADPLHLALLQSESELNPNLLAQQHEGMLEAIDEGFSQGDWDSYRETALQHLQTLGQVTLDLVGI